MELALFCFQNSTNKAGYWRAKFAGQSRVIVNSIVQAECRTIFSAFEFVQMGNISPLLFFGSGPELLGGWSTLGPLKNDHRGSFFYPNSIEIQTSEKMENFEFPSFFKPD